MGNSFADILLLKNGNKVRGQVIHEDDAKVVVEVTTGMRQEIPRSLVVSRTAGGKSSLTKEDATTNRDKREDAYDRAERYAIEEGVPFQGLHRSETSSVIQKFFDKQTPRLVEAQERQLKNLRRSGQIRFKNLQTIAQVDRDFSFHTSHKNRIAELREDLLAGFPEDLGGLEDAWVDGWALHVITDLTTVSEVKTTSSRHPPRLKSIDYDVRLVAIYNAKDQMSKAYIKTGYARIGEEDEGEERRVRWKVMNLPDQLEIQTMIREQGRGESGGTPISATITGTGFFITREGYLLTNNHVVQGARKIMVQRKGELLEAKIVKTDVDNDLALLKAEGVFDALILGNSDTVELGEEVCTLGFPNIQVQGEKAKFTKGEINSMAGMRDDPRYFQISVPIQPGNSGGALLDARGRVLGVITMKLNAAKILKESGDIPQNVGYAVKINLVRDLLAKNAKLKGLLAFTPDAKDSTPTWTEIARNAEAASGLIFVEK